MAGSDVDRLVERLARIEGVRVRSTGANGYLLYLPDGTTAAVHRTPSDRRRAMKNFRARLKRSGIDMPGGRRQP